MPPYHIHKSKLLDLISMPIIWSGLIPAIIIDVWMELYHRICFPMYGLPYVQRSKYIRIDRHKIKDLNIFEKFGCVYCGYVNGLLHYMSVIAANTEKYWCAIRHERKNGFIDPVHHAEFYEYGSEDIKLRVFYKSNDEK